MMRKFLILAALHCMSVVQSFVYSDCTLFDSHMGATFGLTELKRCVFNYRFVLCATQID